METLNSHRPKTRRPTVAFEIEPNDLGPVVSYSFGGENFPQDPGNPRFQSHHVLTNTQIHLTASVKPATTPIVEWHWDFGDGVTGYGPTISHTYITASSQTQIVLTGTLEDGSKVRSHQVINLVPGYKVIINPGSASGADTSANTIPKTDSGIYPDSGVKLAS